jgi:bacteriorhodopsin
MFETMKFGFYLVSAAAGVYLLATTVKIAALVVSKASGKIESATSRFL